MTIPIINEIWTTVEQEPQHSIARAFRAAEQYDDAWLVKGLWQPRTILLVHSLEGAFKSIFAYQAAEALATAQRLLENWEVPSAMRVGVLQTEMPDNVVGERLKIMYPDGRIPRNMIVSNEALNISIRRGISGANKFEEIQKWMLREDIEVLVWDTINSMLSALGNPNGEEATSDFYQRLTDLPHKGALVVRHNGKPSKDSQMRESNQKVRGSNVHAEVASAIISLERTNRGQNKATLEIGKLRHASNPEPFECWFDAGQMRLTSLAPALVILPANGDEMTREEVIAEMSRRFGIEERAASDHLKHLFDLGLLVQGQRGHVRTWRRHVPAEPTEAKIASPDIHPQEICNVAEIPDAA